jgi:hypothetical protein
MGDMIKAKIHGRSDREFLASVNAAAVITMAVLLFAIVYS